MAKPSRHRLDELLSTVGSTNEIAPIDRYVLGDKLAKVITQARSDSHSKGSHNIGGTIKNATEPETHLGRNPAAVSDCVRHTSQAQ
jgi:hypothetical protein